MGRNALIAAVVLIATLLGAAALFVVQNSSRQVQLSFDLGFAAWELANPVAAPVLIGICFGVGFVLGGLMFGVRSMRLSSRVRRLEQDLALAGGQRNDDDWR